MGGKPAGPPLMRAGLALTPAIAARAGDSGVRALWVNDSLGEGIEPPEPLVDELGAASLRTIEHAYEAARVAFGRDRGLDTPILREIAEIAGELAEEIHARSPACPDTAPHDPHGYWHALRVSSLGLVLGIEHLRTYGWLDYTQTRRFDHLGDRMAMLASGLLLHDIGKLALPESIRRRTQPMSALEQLEFQRHTEAGIKVVPAGFVAPLVRTVIHSHHERWDGGGYPEGRTGIEIHSFARVAAVADAFDAITSERPYRRALPRAVAVRLVEQGSGSQFDPGVVEIFSTVVLPYPLGHEVTLPDGRVGVVAAVDAANRLTPTVRVLNGGVIDEQVIDLSEQFAAGGVSEPQARAA
jgi:hypothetical protein